MIGIAESLLVFAVAVWVIGLAVFKSRRVRIVISIFLAITVVRALCDYAFG